MAGKYKPVYWLCCVMIWIFGTAAGKVVMDPSATVQSLLKAVKVLSEEKAPEKNFSVIREISQTFDLVGISKACLLDTWEKLSPEERQNFVSLFQDVLEKVAYPKSAKFFKDTDVEIDEITKNELQAQIITLVIHPEEGEVEVGFCLKVLDGKWLIEDILLDGVSLQMDLRSQMQKILREDSYKELKRRLSEKLAE